MKLPRSAVLGSLAALAAIAVVVGCSRSPVAPQPFGSDAYVAPKFARVADPSPGSSSLLSGGLSGSGEVNGATGGEVAVGRFRVVVPPGAFQGLATITIQVPDPDVISCELDITPASANGFLVPVSLVADCAGATNVNLANCGTLWYDEQAGVWRTVNGTIVDLVNSRVTAQLPHFSTYGVADLLEGKAGW